MATTSVRNGSLINGTPATAKRRPIYSRRCWPLNVAVFEFENEGRINHSIELTRSFRRDKDAEWETTSYLTNETLLLAAWMLEETFAVLQARQESLRSERAGDEHGPEGIPF